MNPAVGLFLGVPPADEEDPPELPLKSDIEQVYDSDEGDFDDRLTLDSHCSDDSSDDSILGRTLLFCAVE